MPARADAPSEIDRLEGLKLIPESALQNAIARTPLDYYVLWTGSPPVTRGGSIRARALECVHEAGVPVPLRVVVQRAGRLSEGLGLHPDAVREGVRQHQSANAAVVLLLRKLADGSFVAVTEIRNAVDLGRRFQAGEIVLRPRGEVPLRRVGDTR